MHWTHVSGLSTFDAMDIDTGLLDQVTTVATQVGDRLLAVYSPDARPADRDDLMTAALRNDLLDAMLETWEDSASVPFPRPGGGPGDTEPAAPVTDHRLLPVELAIRYWSRRDPAVAERLRRVDNRRMSYLRSLFAALYDDEDKVEARSVLAFALAIGHHFLATDHGARTRGDALELALKELLT